MKRLVILSCSLIVALAFLLSSCSADPAVAQNPLTKATSSLLHTSWQGNFQILINAKIKDVKAMPKIDAKILQPFSSYNNRPINGIIQYQNQQNFKVTVSTRPGKEIAIEKINGVTYAKTNQNNWIKAPSSSLKAHQLLQIKKFFLNLQRAARYTNLGKVSSNGVPTTIWQASIQGSRLETILTNTLNSIKNPSLRPTINQLLLISQVTTINQATVIADINTPSQKLLLFDLKGGLLVDLNAIRQFAAPNSKLQGLFALSLKAQINYSDYGQHFSFSH